MAMSVPFGVTEDNLFQFVEKQKKPIKVCYLQNPMISINLRTFYLGTISLFS